MSIDVQVSYGNVVDVTVLAPSTSAAGVAGVEFRDGELVFSLSDGRTVTTALPRGHGEFEQTVPSSEWFIRHSLGKRPSVTVVDTAGSVLVGQVEYLGDDTIRISFSVPVSGKAYLN